MLKTEPTRRQVARGIAWATPVVVLGAAAPMAAASAIVCPPIPTSGAWAFNYFGAATGDLPGVDTCNTGPALWATVSTAGGNRTGVRVYSDSQTGCGTGQPFEKVVEASSTLAGLVVGSYYTVRFEIWVKPGFGVNTCARHPSALTISMGGLPVRSYHTTSSTPSQFPSPAWAPPAGSTAVPISQTCANNTPPASAFLNTVSYTYTFEATATTLPVNLRFRMAATNDSNNDDWLVVPSYVACSNTPTTN